MRHSRLEVFIVLTLGMVVSGWWLDQPNALIVNGITGIGVGLGYHFVVNEWAPKIVAWFMKGK